MNTCSCEEDREWTINKDTYFRYRNDEAGLLEFLCFNPGKYQVKGMRGPEHGRRRRVRYFVTIGLRRP